MVLGTEAYPQLPMKAAALLESVALFLPLIDGNKRTAWTLMVLMLWINGYRHDFSTDAHLTSAWGWRPPMSRLKSAPG
jgi:death-on-curing protein